MAKSSGIYKHGLENSEVHQDVITLELKPTLKRLSIKSNMIFLCTSI